jgi:hypothetical protein
MGFGFLEQFHNVDLANVGNICCSVLPPRQDKHLLINNSLTMHGEPAGQRPGHSANILPHDFGVP